MPKIEKVKKTKKTKPKLTNLPIAVKKSHPKKDPVSYYNCLLTYANQNWHDGSGTKKKITACCRDCKSQAPVLTRQREQELAKLITSYQQVGESLKKLLKPIK